MLYSRDVAQSGSALRSGRRGREFKSPHPETSKYRLKGIAVAICMKKFTACLLFLILFFTTIQPLSAGITDTVQEIAETIERISSVVESATSFIRQIESVTGTRTLIFLFSVLLMCAGIGPTGLIQGRSLFFTAVFINDLIWFFLIGAAYNSPASLVSDMVKANLWILFPFAAVFFLSRLLPEIAGLISRKLFSSSLSFSKARKLLHKINTSHADLIDALSDDMNTGSSHVSVSPETRATAKEMIQQLEDLIRNKK